MATILIVEDEFAIAELVEMILADEGHTVLTAANGRLALERLAKGPNPDLIITDFMMPILDGVGFLKELRNNETHRDIPCIVMSSMPEEAVRQRIGHYAAFIRKPFHLTRVSELVDALTRSHDQGRKSEMPV
jgi:CheY-like chemotaxis protein